MLSKWKCCRRTVTMETNCRRGGGGGGVTSFAPLKLQLLGCRFSKPPPLLSESLHGGASWMQISDRELVGATLEAPSHWALGRFGVCRICFPANPSDHFRHAATPKIVWRNDKGTVSRYEARTPCFVLFFFTHNLSANSDATCSGSEIHSIHSVIHEMNT